MPLASARAALLSAESLLGEAISDQIDVAKTLFVVSSKSGTTLEPNILKDYFFTLAKERVGDDAGSHFVAITDPSRATGIPSYGVGSNSRIGLRATAMATLAATLALLVAAPSYLRNLARRLVISTAARAASVPRFISSSRQAASCQAKRP